MQYYTFDCTRIFFMFYCLSLSSDELSKINCTVTNMTLNITWQAASRNIFTKESHNGYRITVWTNKTKFVEENLHYSTKHYFLKDLGKTVRLLSASPNSNL